MTLHSPQSPSFSYRHLHYFWLVAKEGGMARAADRLGLAVQTVSAQVRELEQSLGHALFKPAGRGLALTEAGQAAFEQAELIFQLGQQLPDRVRDAATTPVVRLAVGVADSLPKLVVHRLMLPVLAEPHLRLLCHEDAFDGLLAQLALHRLDVVLADRPAPPPHGTLRLYSHRLGASALAWYGTPTLVDAAAQADFPHSLQRLPVLLPSAHATTRAALDAWFERHNLRPRVVGEFQDSALLKTFGAGGLGVFPAAELVGDELCETYGVRLLGRCGGVEEAFWAIGTEKRVMHPLVQRLLQGVNAPAETRP